MVSENDRNYAFISYSHCPKDKIEARLLQLYLEWYKLPKKYQNNISDSKYLRPIWRDETDMNGDIDDDIRNALKKSEYLILICSPNAVNSDYINNKEIDYFANTLKRGANIIPYIIDGKPYSKDPSLECFPEKLKEYNTNNHKNVYGYNVKELGRRKAQVKVVSQMLSRPFDELWQRHKRHRRKQIFQLGVFLLFIVIAAIYLMLPVNLSIALKDDNNSVLPVMRDGILVVNGAEYPITKATSIIEIKDLSVWFRGKDVPVEFSAIYYDSVKTSVKIGFGFNQNYTLQIHRDKSFGLYSGHVVDQDGNYVEGASVIVGGYSTSTDKNGYFIINIPVEEQTTTKRVIVEKIGVGRFESQSEWPRDSILFMIR